jgi:hypothetical protein
MNEIYANAIKTKRAFIHFDMIQHFSWNVIGDNNYELKIYSQAGYIIENFNKSFFEYFLKLYKEYKNVGEQQ